MHSRTQQLLSDHIIRVGVKWKLWRFKYDPTHNVRPVQLLFSVYSVFIKSVYTFPLSSEPPTPKCCCFLEHVTLSDFKAVTIEIVMIASLCLSVCNFFLQCYFVCCYPYEMRIAVAQWLRCCAANRKVVGSIPSVRTMALESTRPLTEMSTRSVSRGVKSGRCVRLRTLSPSWVTVT